MAFVFRIAFVRAIAARALCAAFTVASCTGSPAIAAAPPAAVDANAFLALVADANARTRAQDWPAAIALWQRIIEQNPVEPSYWDNLGAVLASAKRYREAIDAYQHSFALNDSASWRSAYNIACAYALLGDKPSALRWLERSFALRMPNITGARSDTDLLSLHDDPAFQALVGTPDVSKLSRDEGLRYDLHFIAREAKRKRYEPFRTISERDFDAAVSRIDAAIPRLTDAQVAIEFQKLLSSLGDGHTGTLGFPTDRADLQLTLPLQMYLFEEGLYVIAADPKYRELLGAQVLRIGGKPVVETIAAVDPLISRDRGNTIWPKQRAPYLLRMTPLLHALGVIPKPDGAQLTIRDAAGKERTVDVAADGSQPNIWNVLPNPSGWVRLPETVAGPVPLYLRNMGTKYWFEYLPDAKTVYFQYNSVTNAQNEPLAAFAARLGTFIDEHDVDKLVIDLRWNNGGNTMLNTPLLNTVIAARKVNQRGKLFVIVGRRVYSAAQNAASLFQRQTSAIFVGEPTGSSPNFIGEESFVTLPFSKILANVSDLFWESSWPFDDRMWLAPQIYVPPTFAAFRVNRDPALEAILAYRAPSG